MSNEPEVTIILPTYNERENIKELIPRIHEVMTSSGYGDSYEILVVDDNSPDGTAEEARRLAKQYPVRVLVRTSERGLSSAVIAGIKAARGSYCVVMDADFQHPPEIIPKLLEKLKDGYDIVIASRYVESAGIKNWSLYRKIISKIANGMAILIFPQLRSVKDLMSGFFAFRRDLVLKKLDELDPLGYKILLEILVKTEPQSVVEVPYVFQERKYGKSKLGAKVMLEYVVHLIKLSKHSRFYPGKFALVGALGALVNFLVYNLVLLFLPSSFLTLHLRTLIAWIVGVEAGIVNNFMLHEHWTFAPEKVDRTRKGKLTRFLYYHLSNVGYFAITTLVILASSFLIPEPRVDWLIAIVTGYLWNYTIARKIIWRSKTQ